MDGSVKGIRVLILRASSPGALGNVSGKLRQSSRDRCGGEREEAMAGGPVGGGLGQQGTHPGSLAWAQWVPCPSGLSFLGKKGLPQGS